MNVSDNIKQCYIMYGVNYENIVRCRQNVEPRGRMFC